VDRIDYDFDSLRWSAFDQKLAVLRTREFDRTVQAFLSDDPGGLIVNIGCGLDTRFQRVDNGQMQWYGLDLPEVIDLRRQFIIETERSKLIAGSVLDISWVNQLVVPENKSTLFLAEGVFPYFTQQEVRGLVAALKRTFSPTRLAFDATSRLLVRLHNTLLRLRRASFQLRWGIEDPHALESWEAGIRLLKTWYYFNDPDVLTSRIAICRHLPLIRRGGLDSLFRPRVRGRTRQYSIAYRFMIKESAAEEGIPEMMICKHQSLLCGSHSARDGPVLHNQSGLGIGYPSGDSMQKREPSPALALRSQAYDKSSYVCPWWLGYLLAGPVRRILYHPASVLAPHVHEGMTVLEPGPGMGFFTLELARLVGGSGRVIAVDIQPRMLRALRRRAAEAGVLDRLDIRLARPNSMAIADLAKRVDFTLAFAVVHELPNPAPFFQELAQASKVGARLLLVEPRGHVPASKFNFEMQTARDAGFAQIGTPSLRHSHTALFESAGICLRAFATDDE
jgi:SAM-dependent methyltransferase